MRQVKFTQATEIASGNRFPWGFSVANPAKPLPIVLDNRLRVVVHYFKCRKTSYSRRREAFQKSVEYSHKSAGIHAGRSQTRRLSTWD